VSTQEPRNDVTILPVPAAQAVIIQNANAVINGQPAFITDIKGRIVYQFVLESAHRIEIDGWQTGIYFLHLPNGKKMKMVKE
jgi:hypothetical protein